MSHASVKWLLANKLGCRLLCLNGVADVFRALSAADMQREAAQALLKLAEKVNATAPIDAGPQQPAKTVYLGAEYVNNKTLADVTFVVEGREFYAHRIALLASSEAFRAMFNGGYREKEASSINIPNIPYDVFSAMMQYIYTGQVCCWHTCTTA